MARSGRMPLVVRIGRRVGATGLLAATCFAAVELVTRLDDRIMYGVPLGSPYRDQSDLLMRDQHGVSGRPSVQFQKWRMNCIFPA